MTTFTVLAVEGLGEVHPGDDLAAMVTAALELRDGDVLVVTSKVVSKAEGRVVPATRDGALARETDRVVARRGNTTIVRTHHGLVMAAAGIDASNTEPGTVVLLPEDPDRSARQLRERVRDLAGVDVAVVVSDTSGRAWRTGQTDIAIGAAGLRVLDDHAGRTDAYGNLLAVTAPALADEVAGAGDLVKGKLSGSPVAVLRGLSHLVLPPGDHGAGAAELVRPESEDLFGYGAREAVLRALGLVEDDDPGRGFGAPADALEVLPLLTRIVGAAGGVRLDGDALELSLDGTDARRLGRLEARVDTLLVAHGWAREEAPGPARDGADGRARERADHGVTTRWRPATP